MSNQTKKWIEPKVINRKIIASTFVLAALLIICIGRVASADNSKDSGKFSVLTYNVAGLPDLISGSHPAKNTAQISAKLDAFDIVLAQEDFHYHDKLISKAGHKYKSAPEVKKSLGDGLGRLSTYSFGKVTHVAWEKCYGFFWYANDCMTKKGFSVATYELAPGVEIDIYDLHMDAGESKGDIAARSAEMDQLIEFMASYSKAHAVIAGGDWNLRGEDKDDLKILDRLLKKEGLTDSCRSLGCGVERIDRILFRSNKILDIKAVKYKAEEEMFKDKKGKQLSDHIAVSAVFEWKEL